MNPVSHGDLLMDMTINSMTLGCFPGFFSPNFSTTPCVACPVGTYGVSTGMTACSFCPPGTTSRTIGSTSKIACSTCTAGQCVHGDCQVAGDYSTSCFCSAGYTGPSCDVNIIGIVTGSVSGGLALLVLLGIIGVRLRKKLLNYRSDLSLKEALLSTASVELEALQRVMLIEATELNLTKLVDSGSYGEVWLGEYQVPLSRCSGLPHKSYSFRSGPWQ